MNSGLWRLAVSRRYPDPPHWQTKPDPGLQHVPRVQRIPSGRPLLIGPQGESPLAIKANAANAPGERSVTEQSNLCYNLHVEDIGRQPYRVKR